MKKILFSFLTFSLVLSTLLFAAPVAADSQVCGVDNATYSSDAAAESAGIDVSYDSACRTVTSEAGLAETKSDIHFVGMLVEIGSTDLPTNIIVRDNATKTDYTVNITANTVLGQRRDQATNLSDWIPGDQIRVIGKKNENTDTVDATILVNLSIVVNSNLAANGWITQIDKDNKRITYQWANKEHTFKYDDNTRFVVGLKNPASVDDLAINDRIRGRLLFRQGEEPLAKIVVVLRRGTALFMKIRTFIPEVTLVRMDSTIVPTTIQVRMDKTPGLRANDVNNLIGTEGALITVNITEDTKIVRKYFGRTTLSEFSVGDRLKIVGRVNDDGTIDAKLVKNNSIWKLHTQGYAAIVTAVDVPNSNLMVNYTPIKYLTQKELKEKLSGSAITAQSVADSSTGTGDVANTGAVNTISKSTLKDALRARIKTAISETIGKFKRDVQYKKVEISRIQHDNVTVGDLIIRLPVQKWRVDINENTKIIIGTNTNGTISDIKVGDRIRTRGTVHKNHIFVADVIVVVNSLPEIEEPTDTSINDVNEIVSEITTDDSGSAIVSDTTSQTEEEVESDDGSPSSSQ